MYNYCMGLVQKVEKLLRERRHYPYGCDYRPDLQGIKCREYVDEMFDYKCYFEPHYLAVQMQAFIGQGMPGLGEWYVPRMFSHGGGLL